VIAVLAVVALTVSCTLDPNAPPGSDLLRSVTVNVPEALVVDLDRLVVDVMLGPVVKATHEYTVIAPPFTFDYSGDFDLVVARGYGSSGSLLFTAKGSPDESSEVSITLDYVGVGSADHVVIFQDGLPWDSSALTDMLVLEGVTEGTGTDQHEIITSDSFAAFVLDPSTDLLIIANDQDQDFYNAIATNNDAILAFINAGGSIVDAGITMPGDVTLVLAFEDYNIIEVPDHPIFQGVTV
jgi:hypothetical protein